MKQDLDKKHIENRYIEINVGEWEGKESKRSSDDFLGKGSKDDDPIGGVKAVFSHDGDPAGGLNLGDLGGDLDAGGNPYDNGSNGREREERDENGKGKFNCGILGSRFQRKSDGLRICFFLFRLIVPPFYNILFIL